VIEEAVVLVVHEKECRPGPDLRVRGERVENFRTIPGAIISRPVGVLRVGLRRNDPRDLGQRAGENVGAQDIEERSTGGDVGSSTRILIQRATRLRVLVLMKVEQRVVAVVADMGIARPAQYPFASSPTPLS